MATYTLTSGGDVVTGTDGNDLFDAYTWAYNGVGRPGGIDTINGGAGDDTFAIGFGAPNEGAFDGGTGNDKVPVLPGAEFGTMELKNVELLEFIDVAYTLRASAAQLSSFSTIRSSNIDIVDFHFTLQGIAGTIDFSARVDPDCSIAANLFFMESSGSIVTGTNNNDVFIGSDFDETLNGADGDDEFGHSLGVDTLNGGAGNDYFSVVGDAADGAITGGTGTDTVTFNSDDGSLGTVVFASVEILELGSGTLEATIAQFSSFATIVANKSTFASVALSGAGGTMDFSMRIADKGLILRDDGVTAGYTVIGTNANDSLSGSVFKDVLKGGHGNDILSGGKGVDRLEGGSGNDTYISEGTDMVVEGAGDGTDTIESSVTIVLSANVEKLTLTGSASINGTGNNLANTVTGNAGANILNGAKGADRLVGGSGSDIYVTDGGDTVVEAAGEGTDTIRSSVTYTLKTNVENLILTGSAAIKGFGNTLANVLDGSQSTAANILTGLQGNDTYIVGAGDSVSETVAGAAGGTDTVKASVSFVLGTNVEKLTLLGSSAINGTGNSLANIITGNTGVNILNGGTGSDTLAGGLGNDTYVTDGGDSITEAAGQGMDTVQSKVSYGLGANVENLTLTGGAAINGTGNALANSLIGNSSVNVLDGGNGADRLAGGLGNDVLFGGLGNDVFVFDKVPTTAGNRDAISDFSGVSGNNDVFHLDNAVFTKLGGTGALNSSFFKLSTQAQDANDYIIYDKTTGGLSYDADGNKAGGSVQFAILLNAATLTSSDFVVI